MYVSFITCASQYTFTRQLATGHQLWVGGGGASEVLPLQKDRAERVLAILKGDHKKLWGSFNTGA